jgi:hypothetical protein
MLAHAFLAVTAAERAHGTITHALIPLTCNEIRHLFIHLTSRAGHGVRVGGLGSRAPRRRRIRWAMDERSEPAGYLRCQRRVARSVPVVLPR